MWMCVTRVLALRLLTATSLSPKQTPRCSLFDHLKTTDDMTGHGGEL